MNRDRLEPLVLAGAFLALLVWYARPQAVYSLLFFYRLAEYFLPQALTHALGG